MIPPILISLYLFVPGIFGQSQATSGNIEGRVMDKTGAVIAGILITASNQDTGFIRSTRSDRDGGYILVLLPLGTYTVEAGAEQGFAAAVFTNLPVTLGAKRSIDFILEPVLLADQVEINSESPGIETTQTSGSTTLDERRVSLLPILRRNFLDIAVTTPGVTRDPGRGGVFSLAA